MNYFLVLDVLVLIVLAVCLLGGLIRGFKKSLRKLIALAIPTICLFIFLGPITNAVMNIEVDLGKINNIVDVIPEEYTESLLPKPVTRKQEYSSSFDDWDDFDYFGSSESAPAPKVYKQSSYNTSVNMGTLNYSKPKVVENNNQWRILMQVKHRRFGLGKIVAVSGSGEKTMVTVAFENNGIKNLIAAQANLEIIGE